MSYFFRAYETTRFKAMDTTLCPISPGQYLICKDSGDVYYDTEDGVRKQLTDIVDLETESQRIAILTPIDKIYFVKETAHFWRYLNDGWVDLSNVNVNIGATLYTKIFNVADWSVGKIIIPVSEHKLVGENSVLTKIYMLKNNEYTDNVLAVMDTQVSVDEDKNVVLSYSGPGYAGKVLLYG